MAKEEWGTKRICPETGKRFYDLNNDPVISPYTGKEITLEKSSSDRNKSSRKDQEPINKNFEESDDLLTMDDDLILDEGDDSPELDDELLEEEDQDTVPLEEITDVPSNEGEEN
tara:strand:- start:3 stop:344 length:342 start_codon:yes stop_codon:yes gene_type:complete